MIYILRTCVFLTSYGVERNAESLSLSVQLSLLSLRQVQLTKYVVDGSAAAAACELGMCSLKEAGPCLSVSENERL